MRLQILYIILLFCFSPFIAMAQPGNYWSNSFNTEASLLAGAVVGGNAGITAIFYNPAGISEIQESRFDLNASLFNLESKQYSNPLGEDTEMDNYTFKVFPRFTSYVYQSKKVDYLTYQFAIFNRNSAKTNIYNRVLIEDANIMYPSENEEYTGLFDLSSTYDDYWGSFAVSKRINDHWSLGFAFNISVQSLNYMRSANSNLVPVIESGGTALYSSHWQSYEHVQAYNWRFIAKMGVMYRKNNISAGLNITLPSVRLFGNADVNRTISQTNILYENQKLPDKYLNEYPQYVYFKMQDPLSLAFGLKIHDKKSSDYYLTIEYFMPIKTYNSIDGTKGVADFSTPASSFSSYSFGNRSVLNIAIGYKKMLTETLGFLAGFRTDSNPYIMGHNEKYWELNSFEALNINLFHLTGGVKFDYRKSSFIVGLQNSFGYKFNQYEFINFSQPEAYNPTTKLALQGTRSKIMSYVYNSLGFYLGFSIAF